MVNVKVCAGEDCGVEHGDEDTVTVGGMWCGDGVCEQGGGCGGGATVAVC